MIEIFWPHISSHAFLVGIELSASLRMPRRDAADLAVALDEAVFLKEEAEEAQD